MKRLMIILCAALTGFAIVLVAQENGPAIYGQESMIACQHIQDSIDNSMVQDATGYVKDLMGAEYSSEQDTLRSIVITVEYPAATPSGDAWYVYDCSDPAACSKEYSFSRCGMQSVDSSRLIAATAAWQYAVQTGGCPADCTIETITLYWYDVPQRPEPTWTFISHEGLECRVGAYTGTVFKRCPSRALGEGLGGILLDASAENSVPVNGELAWFIQEEYGATGYTWQFEQDDSDVYELAYEFLLHPSILGLGGGSVMRVWVFQAVQEGVANLQFGLYRFCSTEPIETITVTIRGVPEE